MNDNTPCHFHPDEVVVGVCRLCLNDRLLLLATRQKKQDGGPLLYVPRYDYDPSNGIGYAGRGRPPFDKHQRPTPPAATLPKIFALGSFLNRLEFRHCKPHAANLYHDASSSHEDSFISIRFEDNGLGSWEKKAASKESTMNCKETWNHGLSKSMKGRDTYTSNKEYRHQHGATGNGWETKTVIEHPKPQASLRWRRRIGHLFHLIRWKRSSKESVCHVDGVKVRNGWMRTLTRRKTEG